MHAYVWLNIPKEVVFSPDKTNKMSWRLIWPDKVKPFLTMLIFSQQWIICEILLNLTERIIARSNNPGETTINNFPVWWRPHWLNEQSWGVYVKFNLNLSLNSAVQSDLGWTQRMSQRKLQVSDGPAFVWLRREALELTDRFVFTKGWAV